MWDHGVPSLSVLYKVDEFGRMVSYPGREHHWHWQPVVGGVGVVDGSVRDNRKAGALARQGG